VTHTVWSYRLPDNMDGIVLRVRFHCNNNYHEITSLVFGVVTDCKNYKEVFTPVLRLNRKQTYYDRYCFIYRAKVISCFTKVFFVEAVAAHVSTDTALLLAGEQAQ